MELNKLVQYMLFYCYVLTTVNRASAPPIRKTPIDYKSTLCTNYSYINGVYQSMVALLFNLFVSVFQFHKSRLQAIANTTTILVRHFGAYKFLKVKRAKV